MVLYRYQGITGYSLDNLSQKSWWFSPPTDFNDPFECRLQVPDTDYLERVRGIDKIKKNLAEYISQGKDLTDATFSSDAYEISHIHSIISKNLCDVDLVGMTVAEYQKRLNTLGIVCLTERNDEILMWAHYADHHKGVCFEFETNEETSQCFVKVNYANDYPELNFENFPEIEKMFNPLLVTKSVQWEYEQEWRCVRSENGLFPYLAKLTGVIFGARITHKNKEEIKARLRDENDIRYLQARLHPYQYKLIIEPDE